MKFEEKQKALLLRKEGKSIKEIAKNIKVSKASVSIWVRDIKLTPKQNKFLSVKGFTTEAIEKRRESRLNNEFLKREAIIKNAGETIREISKKDLKIIGSIFYWAEGTKRGNKRVISFSNSDPFVIEIMMKFFREICFVPEDKFRGYIHTYSHLNSEKSEKYWSSITKIPVGQFYKTYSKPSKSSVGKMDSLPYGTFDIYVCDTKLFLAIIGWIEKIKDILLKI